MPVRVCDPESVADAAPAPDPLPAAVRRFVAAQVPVRLDCVALHTRLAEDLHLQGDDALALMEHFFDHFDVDPAAFRFDRFFTPEGVWPGQLLLVLLVLLLLPVLLVWHAIGHAGRRDPSTYRPITVADLVEAARTRHWPLA